MLPLRSILAYEATASFARVFEGILSKSEMKDWFYSKTASNLGKKGGRQEGREEESRPEEGAIS